MDDLSFLLILWFTGQCCTQTTLFLVGVLGKAFARLSHSVALHGKE